MRQLPCSVASDMSGRVETVVTVSAWLRYGTRYNWQSYFTAYQATRPDVVQ